MLVTRGCASRPALTMHCKPWHFAYETAAMGFHAVQSPALEAREHLEAVRLRLASPSPAAVPFASPPLPWGCPVLSRPSNAFLMCTGAVTHKWCRCNSLHVRLRSRCFTYTFR